MTTFPNSPNHAKGALILQDPVSGNTTAIIPFQFTPTQLTRSLKVQGASEGGDRSEAMRITGPPVETIQLEAELDLTDKLEKPDENENAVQFGLRPELAALESILYPEGKRLQENHELAEAGMLEILPAEAPLTLFGWGKNRLLAVRITECNITEELFDQQLNPIRAKVTLGMQVLSINDLPYGHRGSTLYMRHHYFIENMRELSGVVVDPEAGITL